MKYGYPEIIAALYPNCEFSTHASPDKQTIERIKSNDIPEFWIGNDFVVEWLDKSTPMPTADDITSKIGEAEAIIDAQRASE